MLRNIKTSSQVCLNTMDVLLQMNCEYYSLNISRYLKIQSPLF